jgi:FkbM family methyltransferase
MNLKRMVKRVLSQMGYKIQRISHELGQDPFQDMAKLAVSTNCPVVFDVGANVGQSIALFRNHFKNAVIHAFEPSPDTFRELQKCATAGLEVYLNNCALGSQAGIFNLIENTNSLMSSFLQPGQDWWGGIRSKTAVEVKTLDEYCRHHEISHIDILKSDTQGFDLEVLKGAQRQLGLGNIHMIFLEITFSDMYKGLPRLDEIYAFLIDRGFALVSFYKFEYQNKRAGWTDGLFINPKYKVPIKNTGPIPGSRCCS